MSESDTTQKVDREIAVALIDTSVWVSYLREGNKELEALLNNGEVMCHPFIVGELACGNMRKKRGNP